MALPEKEQDKHLKDVEIEEVGKEPKLPSEVSSWVEQVEVEPQIPPDLQSQGVTQVGANIPVIDDTTTLPLTEPEVKEGLHQKAQLGFRWLAEWCFRQLKIVHEKMNQPLKIR